MKQKNYYKRKELLMSLYDNMSVDAYFCYTG